MSDAAEMVAVLSSEDLYTYTGGSAPTLSDLDSRYRAQVAGSPDPRESWFNWIVRLPPAGTAIGYVQATVTGGDADLAWVIGASWQRKGYAAEAARGMRSWLEAQGINGFTAHIHPEHRASERVATAIGLVTTRTYDEDGEQLWRLETDLEKLVAAWWTYHRLRSGDRRARLSADGWWWAEALIDAQIAATNNQAADLLEQLAEKATSPVELELVGAGPIEIFVVEHGEYLESTEGRPLLDALHDASQRSEALRRALRSVSYRHDEVAPSVRTRILGLPDPIGE